MKFLIDENVGIEVETFLVEAGHDVKRVSSGSENGEVMRTALAEKRLLVTHDIHFSNILMYPRLLNKVAPEEFSKRLYVLEEDDFRVR